MVSVVVMDLLYRRELLADHVASPEGLSLDHEPVRGSEKLAFVSSMVLENVESSVKDSEAERARAVLDDDALSTSETVGRDNEADTLLEAWRVLDGPSRSFVSLRAAVRLTDAVLVRWELSVFVADAVAEYVADPLKGAPD